MTKQLQAKNCNLQTMTSKVMGYSTNIETVQYTVLIVH